jgi:hypothetical protein
MGDTEWETFSASDVDWVTFRPDDSTAAVEMVRKLLLGEVGGPLVRIESPEPPRPRGLLGRFKKVERMAAQVVAGRQGGPLVLTVGDETEEPIGRRFERAGVVVPDGWSLAANATFPWVEAPSTADPVTVVEFIVGVLSALGAGAGEWRVGIDTPRIVEHAHGPEGSHTHPPGEHHHH